MTQRSTIDTFNVGDRVISQFSQNQIAGTVVRTRIVESKSKSPYGLAPYQRVSVDYTEPDTFEDEKGRFYITSREGASHFFHLA